MCTSSSNATRFVPQAAGPDTVSATYLLVPVLAGRSCIALCQLLRLAPKGASTLFLDKLDAHTLYLTSYFVTYEALSAGTQGRADAAHRSRV